MATGFLYHELYMWHNTPNFAGVIPYGNPVQPYEHAENPETKRLSAGQAPVSTPSTISHSGSGNFGGDTADAFVAITNIKKSR